jgi:hypothetical protein
VQVINDAESERQRQKKECEVVVSERNILGTQVHESLHGPSAHGGVWWA